MCKIKAFNFTHFDNVDNFNGNCCLTLETLGEFVALTKLAFTGLMPKNKQKQH